MRRALKPIQRRQDVFMAGTSETDGETWVCSMGHLMGLLDQPWLGIPATGKLVFLRYAEFHRVLGERIAETGFFCDIIGVMKQVGLTPLPLQTGAEIIIPGPRTHDGLLFGRQDERETATTLALVNEMRHDLSESSEFASSSPELARTWHDGMLWFGPSGIGSTYTIGRYQEQHQGPFSRNLRDITFNGHVCRFAEGKYAGWFGWPNLTMTSTGGFLGLPSNSKRLDMRVVDVYRREGDRLAENWIFIDLLYWMLQQDVDVLERTAGIINC
jgi:predicted ester cyclase